MSPKLYLALVLLMLGAYLFWLTREQLAAMQITKKGVAYGKAVMDAVETHFVELKDKSVFLVEDKGYQVVDDSKWKAEIDKFLYMIVRPKVEDLIKTPTDEAVFHRFATTMLLQLIEDDIFPRQFPVEKYAAGAMQSAGEAKKLLVPARWFFSMVFIAVAIFSAIHQGWLAALLMLIAGSVINPLTHQKVVQKAPWYNRYNLGLWAALVVVLLANISYYQHTQAISDERQARLAELQKQRAIERQRTAEQRRVDDERERLASEAQAANLFATKRLEVLDSLNRAIQEERFTDAKAIMDEYSTVSDSALVGLKTEYILKKEAFEAREAAVKAERDRQENYNTRIRDYAIDEYTPAQYPTLTIKYRSRLAEIENFRRTAAERAIDSGKCDYVENVQLSDESSLQSLKFFIDCANESRIYLTEAELKSGAEVRTQAENAWDEGKAVVACRTMTKQSATIPSSVNFHSFTGTSASTAVTTGNVEVLLNFDAKNVFGTEIGYMARCVFEPRKQGSIEIFLRE
ncbi:hypothetical protein BN1049_01618 [Pseudomonas saudimassiliensis]|uniref:Uncharacterized protein n=1 Tax=Pseudomonas saudimassiliensis TaxID=1461581 RepID=A0A078ME89_9PSED|nr:hypothetical protein [Pseudomonas saudimassiliensis]CEA04559.1 hypothetical protein BN1049_01618 [Pseudomonas saudimassiliensis]CEF26685.1 hypothetical protein BN1049_01618 [Pseudomonas saudimassiliensis]